MAEMPIYFTQVSGPPAPARRGPKPGNGRIQRSLREARKQGVDRWHVFPDQCKASFQRCQKQDPEFRDVVIMPVKRRDNQRHDVYVMFPSGGGR